MDVGPQGLPEHIEREVPDREQRGRPPARSQAAVEKEQEGERR